MINQWLLLPSLLALRAKPQPGRTRQLDTTRMNAPLDDLARLPPKQLTRTRLSPPPGFQWSTVPELTFPEETKILPVPDIPAKNFPQPPRIRECLDFAIPAIGANTAGPLMSLIDATFVGRVSSLELAALGPAGSVSDSACQLLTFAAIAATNLVASSHASGDAQGSARTATLAVIVSIVGGSILSIATFGFAKELCVAYCGARSPLIRPMLDCLLIRASAFPAATVSIVASAVCIGTKDARTPLAAILVAAIINLLGDFIFVHVLGLGLRGAAWATIISQYCGAFLLLRVLSRRNFLLTSFFKTSIQRQESFNSLVSIFSFIPFMFVMLLKTVIHNSSSATAAALGSTAAAAHTALFSIAMLCFTVGDVGSSLCQAYLPAFIDRSLTTEHATMKTSQSSSGKRMTEPKNESGRFRLCYPRTRTGRVLTNLIKAARFLPRDVLGWMNNPRRAVQSKSGEPRTNLDLVAARPTIIQLLKTMFGVSACVVAIAATIIIVFSGKISCDPAVVRQMLLILPFMAAALSLHGTTVTLEGLLLAQKDFSFLSVVYIFIASSCVMFHSLIRRYNLGLFCVWSVYIYFQFSRLVVFSLRGFRTSNRRRRA